MTTARAARAHAARQKKRATRLLDELVDAPTMTLLEDTLHALRDRLRGEWTASAIELDNGQARAVLALLEAAFLETRRPETLRRLRRAQWIYLDSWYRSEHMGHQGPRKTAVMPDLCAKWQLRESAIKKAIRDGREWGERVRVIWSQRPGERIPQLEALIRAEQKRNAGRIRGR
jgi:hypothetical protein